MSALEEALEEFGAQWREGGWWFGHPGEGAYISVMDEVSTYGSDAGGLVAHRHSAYLELYDAGTDADVEARRRLSATLEARNLKHTRRPPDYLRDIKRAVTVYDLEDWIERG